jgi:DNA-binding IclR family transcriptional regulator
MSKIVERTLDFLELFVEQKRPLSLSDISRLLNIPVSSCHDVLQSLQLRGFMYEVSPRGGYYPTLRMYEAGKTIAENDPVLLRADHQLRELRDQFDESVLLAKVSGLKGTYLLSFETSHALRLKLKVGDNVTSLHAASAGKAILGSLDDDALDAALDSIVFTAFTKHTVRDKDRLKQLIREGQAKGIYVNIDESMEGLTTISAPFHWQRSLYIVTMVLPTSRLQNRLPTICANMLAACRKLEMKPSPVKQARPGGSAPWTPAKG